MFNIDIKQEGNHINISANKRFSILSKNVLLASFPMEDDVSNKALVEEVKRVVSCYLGQPYNDYTLAQIKNSLVGISSRIHNIVDADIQKLIYDFKKNNPISDVGYYIHDTISKQNLSTKSLIQHKERLDWDYISENRKFDDDEIEKFKSYLNWDGISMTHNLSIPFLEKYDVSWHFVCRNKTLTPEIIRHFYDRFDKVIDGSTYKLHHLNKECLEEYLRIKKSKLSETASIDPKITIMWNTDKPKTSDFNKALITSSSEVLYKQMLSLLSNQYSEYKPLFQNRVMKGMLYTVFQTCLEQTLSMCDIKNETADAILDQLKTQGISSITLGGIEFGESLLNNFKSKFFETAVPNVVYVESKLEA